MNKIKINYTQSYATQHSRDYYRGKSFHFSGKWVANAHYISDDYNIDFVVHGQALLACAKSHLSTIDNEPVDFITDESGTIIGVASTYWDFVLSGIVGHSPGIKIVDNYWYICDNVGVPVEEQVWVNTGVKAKMELSDLTPGDIELLQRPGKELIQDFLANTVVQETGTSTEKIMSQKAVTDTIDNLSDDIDERIADAVSDTLELVDDTYQPKGDYATNDKVDSNKQIADNKDTATNARIDTTNQNVTANANAIAAEVQNRTSEIDRVAGLVSAEATARETADSGLSERITAETEHRQESDNLIAREVSTITGKIPLEASSGNQLADKQYVITLVSQSAADFVGTFDSLEELEQQAARRGDYGMVRREDEFGTEVFDRYKYTGTE